MDFSSYYVKMPYLKTTQLARFEAKYDIEIYWNSALRYLAEHPRVYQVASVAPIEHLTWT